MEVVKLNEKLFSDTALVIVAGPSGSGKTSILLDILKHRDTLFPKKPAGVVYAYGTWQKIYEDPICNTFHFVNGVPSKDVMQSFIDKFKGDFFLLIIDDLMSDVSNSQVVGDIFYKRGAS